MLNFKLLFAEFSSNVARFTEFQNSYLLWLRNTFDSLLQVWRTLSKTYSNMKRRPVVADLNPKAVTNDDLFGVINSATREWKDGI
jgi:tRNA(His) 5'-end guanylyltransferase